MPEINHKHTWLRNEIKFDQDDSDGVHMLSDEWVLYQFDNS